MCKLMQSRQEEELDRSFQFSGDGHHYGRTKVPKYVVEEQPNQKGTSDCEAIDAYGSDCLEGYA